MAFLVVSEEVKDFVIKLIGIDNIPWHVLCVFWRDSKPEIF